MTILKRLIDKNNLIIREEVYSGTIKDLKNELDLFKNSYKTVKRSNYYYIMYVENNCKIEYIMY